MAAGAARLNCVQPARIGRRLAGADVEIRVVGHVVTVPGGRTSGGSVVAQARALVAARYSAESGNIPPTDFTLVSADQTEGPFDSAARNRTVTLVITPWPEVLPRSGGVPARRR